MKFSERLRSVMDEKRISAADIERRTGISRGTIHHYLREDYSPKLDRVETLASVLGVSVSYLAGLSDDPNPTGDPAMDEFLDTFTRMSQPGSFGTIRISAEELRIIQAFRDADPVLQSAVLRLLDLEADHGQK